jgi:hypothetical protein
MIKNNLKSISATLRGLFSHPGTLAIFAGLYALLLADLYGFIATKEAKVWQVLLTLIFIAGAPVLFFLFQAVIINSARAGHINWSRALLDSCRLALLTLPLVLIGWAIAYLLNRWQAHHLMPLPPAPSILKPGQKVPEIPTHWPTAFFATARTLIYVVALPLLMINLWVDLGSASLLTFLRTGAKPVFKTLGQTVARAFAFESVLVYALGLVVFGLIPYALLFVKVPLGGTWREVSVFTLRLTLVFVFTLFGWVITLSTFARRSAEISSPTPTTAETPTPISKDDGELSAA